MNVSSLKRIKPTPLASFFRILSIPQHKKNLDGANLKTRILSQCSEVAELCAKRPNSIPLVYIALYISSVLYSLRIEFACELMRANFLDKFSINALAKNPALNSEKNFYRVFKQLQRITPDEYYDKIKNIQTS